MALRDDVIVRFGGDARGVDATMAAIRTSVSGLGSVMAGLGVGIGFAGITASIKETLGWADDLANTAKRIGLTTDAVQALRIEADHYGVTQEAVDAGLTKFTLNLGKAQQGTGDLKDVLNRYGIALTDVNGKQRSSTAVFADYVALLQRTTNEQERVRIGVAGMGKGAAEFAQAMAESGVPLEQTIARLKEMGLIMDDQGVNKLADLEQKWTTFTQRVSMAAKQAVLGTVSAFEDLQKLIARSITGDASAVQGMMDAVNAFDPGKKTGETGNQSGVGSPSVEFQKYLDDRKKALRSSTEIEAEIWKQYAAEATAIRKGDEEAAIAAQKAQEDAFKALEKTKPSNTILETYQALVGEMEKTPIKAQVQLEVIGADGAWEQLAAGIAKGGQIPVTVGVTPVLLTGDNSLLWSSGSESAPNDLPRAVDQTGANP